MNNEKSVGDKCPSRGKTNKAIGINICIPKLTDPLN